VSGARHSVRDAFRDLLYILMAATVAAALTIFGFPGRKPSSTVEPEETTDTSVAAEQANV